MNYRTDITCRNCENRDTPICGICRTGPTNYFELDLDTLKEAMDATVRDNRTVQNNEEERIMEKFYLGSKLVQAWPAVRITTRDGKFEYAEIGDVVDPNAQKVEEGYRVQYDDGYRSWSPKAVFERSYRPTTGLSFGLAIEAAKKGKRIARAGWNGKNQYVELASSISYVRADCSIVNVLHNNIGNKALAFVGTSGVQLGWLASQADMLADDWYIVE